MTDHVSWQAAAIQLREVVASCLATGSLAAVIFALIFGTENPELESEFDFPSPDTGVCLRQSSPVCCVCFHCRRARAYLHLLAKIRQKHPMTAQKRHHNYVEVANQDDVLAVGSLRLPGLKLRFDMTAYRLPPTRDGDALTVSGTYFLCAHDSLDIS